MIRLTEIEKSYLAGIFDGEGCIGYYARTFKSNKNQSPVHSVWIAVANTDFGLLKWLEARIYLGRIRMKPASGNRRLAWELQIKNKKQAIEFLTEIQPYLVIKRVQADVLLSHLNAEQNIPRGQGIKTPIEVLNRRKIVAQHLKELKNSPGIQSTDSLPSKGYPLTVD